MDFFKLGLRNILGITLPGGIIIMVLFYITNTLNYLFENPISNFEWLKDKQFIIIIGLFIISFILGNLMRLIAADRIDKKSSKYYTNKNSKKYSNTYIQETIVKAKDNLTKNTKGWHTSFPDIDKWIYYADKFPYTLWEFRKFETYHPREFLNFYEGYKNCMIQEGKGFFNYCKMVIISSSKTLGGDLKDEIYQSEANSRFFAGTYFALYYSMWILIISAIIPIVKILFLNFQQNNIIELHIYSRIIVPFVLAIIMYLFIRLIIKRYRNIRLKEVDTVYDAFYLVHKHPNFCPICSNNDISQNANQLYIDREKLVKDAYSLSQTGDWNKPIEIKQLINLMKKRSENNELLSSLYFAGSVGDHPYFIKNNHIAIGLSVLPEDAKKADASKLHPEQTEILVIIDGSILLEVEENGIVVNKILSVGDSYIINKNICHKISPINNQNSAYFFIKTNPDYDPNSLNCEIEKMPSN